MATPQPNGQSVRTTMQSLSLEHRCLSQRKESKSCSIRQVQRYRPRSSPVGVGLTCSTCSSQVTLDADTSSETALAEFCGAVGQQQHAVTPRIVMRKLGGVLRETMRTDWNNATLSDLGSRPLFAGAAVGLLLNLRRAGVVRL